MSFRLRDRNKQTPGGHLFYDPVTKYQARPFMSLGAIASNWLQAIRANPAALNTPGMPTTLAQAEDIVDAYVAKRCADMGWADYIVDTTGGGSPGYAVPFPIPSNLSLRGKLAAVAAGSQVLVEWIASGAEAVPQELADKRAETCAGCQLNVRGAFASFFTEPVSRAIQAALEKRKEMNLSTPFDDRINICSACLCPLKLKAHVPIDRIISRITDESKASLWEGCWILKESQASHSQQE